MTVDAVGGVRLSGDGAVLRVLIDRPHRLNAIDLDVLAGLEAMLATAAERRVKVVVLRGVGGSFCSGADLHMVRQMAHDGPALRSFMARLGEVLEGLERAPFVSVAVVEGYAVAGGCELLLACDIAVAAEDARIGDRHVEYGLAPAAGGSVRLVGSTSAAFARYLLLTGELVSGSDAVAMGIAARAVPAEALDGEVDRLVARLASRGRGALGTVKAMLRPSSEFGSRARLERELDLFLEHMTTSSDPHVGLQAFVDGTAATFE